MGLVVQLPRLCMLLPWLFVRAGINAEVAVIKGDVLQRRSGFIVFVFNTILCNFHALDVLHLQIDHFLNVPKRTVASVSNECDILQIQFSIAHAINNFRKSRGIVN